MIKIRFNNKAIFEDVEFLRTENTVTLKGITEENTSGFTTYRMNGEQLGDFSDFRTIYNIDGNSITYSNDGSIYVEQQSTEEELKRQELIAEKQELEEWLRKHDYIGVKIATGRATVDEYADIIEEMKIKANRINEINELLK